VDSVRFSFEVGSASGGSAKTSARVYAPQSARLRRPAPVARAAAATLVLAPGAGAPQTHPWMVEMAKAIAGRGIEVVTFDFLYAAARRRAPDKNDVLEATWRAALEAVRARGRRRGAGRVFIGGKSMGGRIASQVAAQAGVDVEGLVLLGYPLHPPGRPDKPRTVHLPGVRAPMLFVQGSRDAFGTPEELAPVLERITPAPRLYVVDGGDHSFAVPRSGGIDPAAVIARVADEVARFIG
jgi:predicted alpha/beta-hydrolase family hydrolase